MALIVPIGSLLLAFLTVYIITKVAWGANGFILKKYSDSLTQKITDFKNRTFTSYEEESAAKQQFRQELLLELENTKFSKGTKKVFETRIDTI